MELKCKSCGGELQKNESVYICEKCGETYSASEINEAIKIRLTRRWYYGNTEM